MAAKANGKEEAGDRERPRKEGGQRTRGNSGDVRHRDRKKTSRRGRSTSAWLQIKPEFRAFSRSQKMVNPRLLQSPVHCSQSCWCERVGVSVLVSACSTFMKVETLEEGKKKKKQLLFSH